MLSRGLFCALVFFSMLAAAWGRPWTDRHGRVIEAKFVRLNGDSVVLLKGNKPVMIPLSTLSDADQEYVRQQVSGKAKPKDDEKDPPDAEAKPGDPEKKAEKPATPPLAEGERLWTDIRGKTLAAKFVRVEGGIVYLSHNGQERPYPVAGFGAEDRAHIASLAPPPAPPAVPPSMPSPMATRPHEFPRPSMPRFPERPPMPTVHTTPPSMPRFERPQPPPSPPPVVHTPPSYTPPSYTPPTPSGPMFEMGKACSKCNKPAPANAKAGDTCKHCGTTWGFEKDEKGNVVGYSSGYMAGKIIGGLVGVIVVISVLLRIFSR